MREHDALGRAGGAGSVDQDRDLAVMALCCRVGEGVISAISPLRMLGLLSIATASTAAAAPEAAAAQALGGLLLKIEGGTGLGWTGLIAGTCFAVGSTIFSYLFLRARSIPVPLAWLGVFASILLVVLLPVQLAGFIKVGFFGGLAGFLMWLPMLLFEVALALWLLTKGVAAPAMR